MSHETKVFFIGGGSGDADLLAVKARRLLESAGCVVYDEECGALAGLASETAEKILARAASSETAALLIEASQRCSEIVRLTAGDPVLFGRIAGEAEALADAGVAFEIIPGIPSPLAAAAYAGVIIPGGTTAVALIDASQPDRIDWEAASVPEIPVLLVGVSGFRRIAGELIAHGRPPATGAVALRFANGQLEQSVDGTLANLASLVERRGLKPPAILLIGEAVALRGKLSWFERLPLFGKRIVVTRARGQAASLSEKLRALGAAVLEIPAIEIRDADYDALDRAIAHLDTYHWLIFTSANGVRHFLQRLDASHTDIRKLRARICAIGPATARAVQALHLRVDLIPEEYVAESLVRSFEGHDLTGKRILLPRAAVARDVVPAELEKRGAQVDVVEAYRTGIPESTIALARSIFRDGSKPDWITFMSSSTVANFVHAVGTEAFSGVDVASIGPVTSETARRHGIQVSTEASQFTAEGLVESIVRFELQRPRTSSGKL